MSNAGTRNAGTTTLLLIEVVIGYEWLVSALTKPVRADSPPGRRPAQEPISNSRKTSFSAIRLCDSSLQPTISGVGSP